MKPRQKEIATSILKSAAGAFHVSPFDIKCKTRKIEIVEARDAAIYMLKTRLTLKNWQIGELFGIIPSSVCYSLKRTKTRLHLEASNNRTWRRRLSMAFALLDGGNTPITPKEPFTGR